MYTKDEWTREDSNILNANGIKFYANSYDTKKEEQIIDRIIQMHNSFEGLLEALKDANQLLGGLPYKNSDIEELIVEGRRKLGQAIAQAEMK